MGIKCPKCHFDNPDDTIYCGKCATPLPSSKEIPVTETLETPTEELTTGSTFAGRYQIIEELGKGGMGKVYRVFDKELKEEVALKLIKPEIASEKKTLERFSNELKLARKISHKNVGRMYELMEEKGTRYITMEYVPGEDLKRLIRKVGQFSAGKTVSIAKQVCKGLTEAHRLGVVHRDLKPQNVMVDEEGNARILDFGIARSVKGKGITGAGVMVGTPEYMSPEQAEVKEVDQRSDIYSLGVILYEMVTGRVPFEGETPLSIAMKHKSEMPKNPREINSQIPEDLSNVVLRCLEKNKEKRYQSAGELCSELENIEKGIPTTEKAMPKRKPITSKEITVTFRLKKLFIPVLVFIAVVIAAVIIWQHTSKKEAITIPAGRPSLAVIYFENNTGDERLEYLRGGLSEWLITDLSQSKFIDVLSGDRIFGILKKLNLLEAEKYSSDDLMKIASQERVNHILKGSYIKVGENFIITAMLQKPHTGEVLSSIKVECKGEEEIAAMVDELTKKIKLGLNLSREQMDSDIDLKVGKITTSSPEAYKYYSEGIKYLWKGDPRQSIQFMEKAVVLDPEFASAYRVMATAYAHLDYRTERRKYHQKAFELSDRVSERERYRIQGSFYQMSEKTYDKAIEAYNKLLELYPEEGSGNNNLGVIYNSLEEWDKAIERFEVDIQKKMFHRITSINQATPYRAKGMYDKARKVLENFIINFSDDARIHNRLALNHLCQGKYNLALVEVNKALSLSLDYSHIRMRGDIYHCKGDLIKAEKDYMELLEREEQTAHLTGRDSLETLYLLKGRFEDSREQLKQGAELAEKLSEKGWKGGYHFDLAYSYIKSGNPAEALKECDKAWSSFEEMGNLGMQRRTLHYKGLACLEMASLKEAQRVADGLKVMIETGLNKKHFRYYYHLMGMIELEKKNLSKAIEYFKDALSLTSSQYWASSNAHAIFIDSLASAYNEAGDLEKAKEQYEEIISLTVDRIYYGDIYAKSFYMLGKIYEEQGDKSKAIEHYEKFLDIWKDADPGIAEVEDAMNSLAGLKSQ